MTDTAQHTIRHDIGGAMQSYARCVAGLDEGDPGEAFTREMATILAAIREALTSEAAQSAMVDAMQGVVKRHPNATWDAIADFATHQLLDAALGGE